MKRGFLKGLALSLIGLAALAGCDGSGAFDESFTGFDTSNRAGLVSRGNAGFYDELGDDYNHQLFHRNDLTINVCDPSGIYVTEEMSQEYGGYFYIYGTSPKLNYHGFEVYRSRNMVDFERCGVAFAPNVEHWSFRDIWAPDIQYFDGKYYLYYTGGDYATGAQIQRLSVAVSDNPVGPFLEYTGTNWNGTKTYDGSKAVFDLGSRSTGYNMIDANVFKDDDGQYYMFFSRDHCPGVSTVYGMRMKDPVSIADDEQWVRMLEPGCSTVGGEKNPNIEAWECVSSEYSVGTCWNEAPFVFKRGGKYYMIYTSNPFWDQRYGIGYATADNPMGPWTKPCSYRFENNLCGKDTDDTSETYWDHCAGTGHGCIIPCGDSLLLGYHSLQYRDGTNGHGGRWFSFDNLYFTEDGTPYVNGPTWSYAPQIPEISGYENIALGATVTSNAEEPELLNDGRAAIHACKEMDLETFIPSGEQKITIDFGEEKTVKGLLVYPSIEFQDTVFSLGKVKVGDSIFMDVGMDKDYIDTRYDYIRPGATIALEFDETTTDKVEITINANRDFALGEIMVFGR